MRTTYNIFLLSRNSANQNIAQVTLTQMVDHIFRRVKANSVPLRNTASTTSLNENINVNEKNEPSTADIDGEKAETENSVDAEQDKSFQEQIIAEANMARNEMGRKLPSGKANDNSEEFLSDSANVFYEETITEVPQKTGKTEPTENGTVLSEAEAEEKLSNGEEHKADKQPIEDDR